MAKQKHPVAKSIAPQVGASVLASLETRTSTEAVQASSSAGLKTGTKFSGQYLYDRFTANDKTEVTKLQIVRDMAGALEVEAFKKVITDFVAVAKGYYDNAVKAAKDAGTYDKDHPSAAIGDFSAKLKTSQNHATVMRAAYGALRFAPDELAAAGYTENTGYQVMRVIALAALASKKIKWDGTAIPDDKTKQARAAGKAESQALADVMAETPRKDGESLKDYVIRMDDKVNAKIAENRAAKEADIIKGLVAKIRKEAGSYLDEVIQALTTSDETTLTVEGSTEAAKEAVKH